jgi:hypothetical protein
MAEFSDIGSGSLGFSSTQGPLDVTLTNQPTNVFAPAGNVTNVTNIITVQSVTFIFRGFYLAGNTYEVWTGLSRNTPPPSGHTLQDITVIGELPVANIF